MTDLPITATQVLPDVAGGVENLIAGEAITAGQVVYLDATTGKAMLSDANGVAAKQTIKGIAMNTAALGQPVQVQTRGTPTLGAAATVVVGTIYVLSATAGGIAPAADLATGAKVCIVGVGAASNKLAMGIVNSGQTVP